MAEASKRCRPGYPVELFDMVIRTRVLVRNRAEIGAGTGKATRLFAQRGSVTATAPDGAMPPSCLSTVPAKRQDRASLGSMTCGRARATAGLCGTSLHWTNARGPVVAHAAPAGAVGCLPRSVTSPAADPAGRKLFAASAWLLFLDIRRGSVLP